ncbi:MAG: RtcB family protein [Candidatus Coproplasma sp.]
MKIIEGRYNQAKIFTDICEESAIEQIKAMCDFEPFQNSKIRIMPDVHTGAGCTIGTTMTLCNAVVPNMVGVDIGCGMYTVRLAEKNIDFEKLDNIIHNYVPSGKMTRETAHENNALIDLTELKCFSKIKHDYAQKSLGSLGGGNHFIEVDKGDDGYYLVIHCGSRHLGIEVAGYYQEEAYRELCGTSRAQVVGMIAKLKAEGRAREIQSAIEALGDKKCDIPKEMAYAQGELFEAYIHDMKIVQRFAVINRQTIAQDILNYMGWEKTEEFTTVHNYIDTDNMILRKGAVSARKGEKLLIPINMRDGALICIGKGNEDWNCSAPHGAGRIYSRGKARAVLDIEEYRRQMDGIYSTSVCKETLDESPMAYKRLEDIVENIRDTVDIVEQIKPVYNFKAAE